MLVPTLSAPAHVLVILGMDAYDWHLSLPDTAALMLPELLLASVGFINVFNLVLPALALEGKVFGVSQDLNTTVVILAP